MDREVDISASDSSPLPAPAWPPSFHLLKVSVPSQCHLVASRPCLAVHRHDNTRFRGLLCECGCSLEGLMLKLKLQYCGYLMRRAGKDPNAGKD